MVKLISLTTKGLALGGLVASSIGFAGVAVAEPSCDGSVPSASSHGVFPESFSGPWSTGTASCMESDDASDTSMADIGTIGTWGHDDIGTIGTWGHEDVGWSQGPQVTSSPQSVTGH
jgi:hypothetical protein